MRLLFDNFLQGNGLTQDDDWQKAAEKVSGSLLNDFFQKYVYGTDDLPLAALLHHVGLALRFQAGSQVALSDEFPPETHRLNFGAKFDDTPSGKVIKYIAHNSLAETAGLFVGDIVLALNHHNAKNWDNAWQQIAANDTVTIHFFRQNRLKQTQFVADAHYQQCPVMKVVDKEKVRQWLRGE